MEKFGQYFNKLSKVAQRKIEQYAVANPEQMQGLDIRVKQLTEQWNLELGEVLDGGTASLIFEVQLKNQEPAVLKIALPGNSVVMEALVLKQAQGNGYALLYDVDFEKEAVLMEKLGTSLTAGNKTIEQHIEIICKTLKKAWMPHHTSIPYTTSVHQALSMWNYIDQKWRELGRPFSEVSLNLMHDYCQARMDAFDPKQAVLVHGDAHGLNILETENGDYKFVDPEGVISDKGYDLICLMRDWNDQLLLGDPMELLLKRCAWLSDLTGVDPLEIWQWGFIGRLMMGVTLMELGDTTEAQKVLEVADRISHHRWF